MYRTAFSSTMHIWANNCSWWMTKCCRKIVLIKIRVEKCIFNKNWYLAMVKRLPRQTDVTVVDVALLEERRRFISTLLTRWQMPQITAAFVLCERRPCWTSDKLRMVQIYQQLSETQLWVILCKSWRLCNHKVHLYKTVHYFFWNRCHFVHANFYKNLVQVAVVIAKCLGGSLHSRHTVKYNICYSSAKKWNKRLCLTVWQKTVQNMINVTNIYAAYIRAHLCCLHRWTLKQQPLEQADLFIKL